VVVLFVGLVRACLRAWHVVRAGHNAAEARPKVVPTGRTWRVPPDSRKLA
jgi:hypothetical protein